MVLNDVGAILIESSIKSITRVPRMSSADPIHTINAFSESILTYVAQNVLHGDQVYYVCSVRHRVNRLPEPKR